MSVLATDDFNRADNASNLGANWSVPPGVDISLRLASNKAYCLGSNVMGDFWNAVSFPADHWAQCTLNDVDTQSDTGMGPAVRMSGSDPGYVVQADTGTVRLYKSSSFTLIGSGSSAADGDVLYLEAIGTALKVKKNGVQIISVTDSTYSAGSAGAFGYSQSEPTNPKLDDWSGGDFASPDLPPMRPRQTFVNDVVVQIS